MASPEWKVGRITQLDQSKYVAPWPPVSRAGNPATSHQAEASINKSGGRLTHAWSLLLAVKAGVRDGAHGLIREQLAEMTGMSEYEASKRLSDLANLGLIRKGPPRRAAGSGRMQSTWWAVEGQ